MITVDISAVFILQVLAGTIAGNLLGFILVPFINRYLLGLDD